SVFETLKKLILASEPEQKTWKGSLIQVPKRFYKNTVLQRALSFYDTQYFPDKKIRAARQDLIKALKSDLAIVFAGTPYEGKIQDLSATKIASLVQASEYADFQDWLKRDLEILIAVESFERSDRNPFH
ncbi:MAG TPA: hypothetical protein PLU50_08335, partial [Pseudobdellovibrionaceae bacterium]|nr:hypothetical protein [Pseudobdellovibrionaceae bacterium]